MACVLLPLTHTHSSHSTKTLGEMDTRFRLGLGKEGVWFGVWFLAALSSYILQLCQFASDFSEDAPRSDGGGLKDDAPPLTVKRLTPQCLV